VLVVNRVGPTDGAAGGEVVGNYGENLAGAGVEGEE